MGRREQFNTRLPADQAEGVKQYADDHDVNKAETLRRAVSDFLDREGYPRDPDAGKVAMASGGHERKPITGFLRFQAGVFGLLMYVGLAGVLLGSPVLSATDYLGLTLASGMLAATFALPLATRYPDHADRWVTYHAERQIGNARARLREVAP